MPVDQASALAEPVQPTVQAEPYSAIWWESRSPEELREFVRGGFQAGKQFEDAVHEIERRARELTQQARQTAAIDAARRKMQLRLLWASVAAVIVLAAAAGLWFGS